MTGADVLHLNIFKDRFERIKNLDQSAIDRLAEDFEVVFEIKKMDPREKSEAFKPVFDFYQMVSVERSF